MNDDKNCRQDHQFSCPESLPASVPDDGFCSPFPCPEKIPTPRFSSPNSPLPPEELEKLKECIEAANEFLRTIGNPNDPDNKRALQFRLRKLRGLLMQVNVNCGSEITQVEGVLKDAGRDFLQLETFGRCIFALFNRLCSLRWVIGSGEIHGHEPALIDLDTCSRRALILDFGKVVSGDPNLINIFFGIPLHLRLISFLGCRVEVETENSGEIVQGVLSDSQERYVHIQTDQKIEQINFNQLCVMNVLTGDPDN